MTTYHGIVTCTDQGQWALEIRFLGDRPGVLGALERSIPLTGLDMADKPRRVVHRLAEQRLTEAGFSIGSDWFPHLGSADSSVTVWRPSR